MTAHELASVVGEVMSLLTVYVFVVAFLGYVAGQVAEFLGVAAWRFIVRRRKPAPFADRVRRIERATQRNVDLLQRIRARMYREAERRGETLEGL
ncbi:hypothetical protein J2W23_000230 [Variovorax boronicumulans]|uniref:hypothetical protein n=1 Tax=Variovorax boronicumulans TaxID=436515 RepID=UPI0027871D48|nr:hypothetical protein [Variovorax boronicumulans]MDQ0011866.1 hypothetical protein [Variovorax boronicumulans]